MRSFKSYAISHGYYSALANYFTYDDRLSATGELILIKSGNVNLVETYMNRYMLRPTSHLALLKMSDTLGNRLLDSGYPIAEDALEFLLLQNRFTDISKYISRYPLHSANTYPKLEVLLLKRAPEHIIRQYINKYCFYDEAQAELMQLYRVDMYDRGKGLIDLFLNLYVPCVNACQKLVERGDKNFIRKAFSKTAFHKYDAYPTAEIKLIELGDTDLFREYVAKYDLFDEAAEALLAPGRDIMLVHYLTYHALRKYEHRVALSQRKDPTLLRLALQHAPLHHEGYFPEAEINMIKLGDKRVIYEYIDKWSLYEEAAEELIKLRDFNLTKTYISKYQLYGTALLELAIEDDPDLIELYCQKYISDRCEGKPTAAFLINHSTNLMGSGILFERNIKKLIASGKAGLIEAFVSIPYPSNVSFSNSEVMFLEMGYDSLAVNYISRHGLHSEQAMLWMFEHKKYNFIKAHMGQTLWGKALVKLVELQNDDLIKEYISRYPLRNHGQQAQAEVLFMKYKNQSLVKSYIAKHGLYDESIVELFKMKNKTLLKVLIDNHALGHVGTMQLLSSKMPDLCLAYVKKHKIDPYFHDLAVHTQNETFIQLLMKDNPLSFRAFNKLAVRKFFTLMKEHVRKYGFPKKDVYTGSPYFYPEQAELDFVAYGDKEMIRKYVSSYLLTPQGEDKLAALGDMSLIQHYLACKKKLEAQNDEF